MAAASPEELPPEELPGAVGIPPGIDPGMPLGGPPLIAMAPLPLAAESPVGADGAAGAAGGGEEVVSELAVLVDESSPPPHPESASSTMDKPTE